MADQFHAAHLNLQTVLRQVGRNAHCCPATAFGIEIDRVNDRVWAEAAEPLFASPISVQMATGGDQGSAGEDPGILRKIAGIIVDLREQLISADEIACAKEPRIQARRRDRQYNSYWINELSNAQRDPRQFYTIRTRVLGIEEVQPTNVERIMSTSLKPGASMKIIIQANSH